MTSVFKHWVERVADGIEGYWGFKGEIVCNGGLSVSGLQHVGRLRGEITLIDAVRRVLEDRGRRVRHLLALYTQDSWKGKPAQLRMFKNPREAERYRGWRLIEVPDPEGCHGSWVEHYWRSFGGHLREFAKHVEVYTTTELYRMEPMKKVVKWIIDNRDTVRLVVNKYRRRRPHPEGWIPYDPLCGSCRRIDSAKPIEVDLDAYKVRYVCRNCGYEGWCSMENGKLSWRLEWVAVWKTLGVMFEPYGKDHATPGGSRDSCVDLAKNVLGFKPPYGVPYEWVGYVEAGRDMGDMGSSDFIGFTPEDWVAVAEPEALRYYYLVNEPMRRITLSLDQVYRYVDLYDLAERIYYGVEKPERAEWELEHIRRSFALAQLKPLPKDMPFQLSYLHAVILVQTLPEDGMLENAIRRLKSTGILTHDPDPTSTSRMESRLRKALNWVNRYAPERFRVKPLERLTPEVYDMLSSWDRLMLGRLLEALKSAEWCEGSIKQAMVGLTSKLPRHEVRRLFRALYLVLFGRESGPRIAPYLAMLERSWVLERLREASA